MCCVCFAWVSGCLLLVLLLLPLLLLLCRTKSTFLKVPSVEAAEVFVFAVFVHPWLAAEAAESS